MNKIGKLSIIAMLAFLITLCLIGTVRSATFADLGVADNFAVLAHETVTNSGLSLVNGDVGVFPGTAVTGFPPGTIINGTTHINDPASSEALANAITAYNDAAGQTSNVNLTGQDLGGMTLGPGVYTFNTSAQLTGLLILSGGPNDVFIFQIGSTLTSASNSSVILIGGADPGNVFWQVGSSATLGTGTAFQGNILAFASVTLNTGCSLQGRALALSGAVTLDTAVISAPPENNPPVADAGGPYILNSEDFLILDAGGSSDSDSSTGDSIVEYAWDLNVDGTYDIFFAVPETSSMPWPTLELYGFLIASPLTGLPTNQVMLRVTDTHGATDTDLTTVTVYDNRPFAALTITPDPEDCGKPVIFDAGASWHGSPDRTIIKYEWDFDNDGVVDYTETPLLFPDGEFDGLTTATFDRPGAFLAALTVTDDNSPAKTDTILVSFNIFSTGPVIAPMSGLTISEGAALVINAVFSNADVTDTHTASIDWGDGSPLETAAVVENPADGGGTVSATHTYADDGVYTATLTVEDDDHTSDSEVFTVTADNLPPVLPPLPERTIPKGEAITITTTFTDPGILDTHTASIDWGDGSPLEPAAVVENPADGGGTVSATHTYADAGEYTATITITDNNGQVVTNVYTFLVAQSANPSTPAPGSELPYTGGH